MMRSGDIERARAFLKERKNFRKVSEETGLDYFWLSKFANGRILDPHASRMIQVLEYIERVERDGRSLGR